MESMTICPHCGGNACYKQDVEEALTTYFCFGCGRSTSSLMKEGSKIVEDTLQTIPELYKDLMFVDENKLVWFPATITLPEKGMVFLDGTSKENWRWAAVKAIEISEEEKEKFGKEQTHKMDMKNIQYFGQRDFIDALDAINFFAVAD